MIKNNLAENFADIVSAIGGTMGLLTGFSFISGFEIIYFIVNYIVPTYFDGTLK